MYSHIILIFAFIYVGGAYSSPVIADSCKVTSYDKVKEAAKRCSTLTIGDLVIPAETTLNIPLQDGANLIFDGHLTHKVAKWTGDLVKITGNNVVVSGTNNHLLDGLGAKHWQGASESTILRPKFIRISLKNSVVKDLKLKNCPNNCIMISASSHLTVSNINIDNYDGYPGVAGKQYAKNTDGFDVGSTTNLLIENSVVINQDDCVAVNSGSNLHFNNLHCNGSHGLSISVKKGDVSNVLFRNSKVENADNVIHIKTNNGGGTGSIYNVTYQNIDFKDVDRYALRVQENYPSGKATANIPITKLTIENIKGTMTGKKSMAMQIVCAQSGCSDWNFKDIKATGAKNSNQCEHLPSGVFC